MTERRPEDFLQDMVNDADDATNFVAKEQYPNVAWRSIAGIRDKRNCKIENGKEIE